MFRRAAPLESLDDDHAPAAAWTGRARHLDVIFVFRVVGLAAGLGLGLRYAKQLPSLGNICGPVAVGKKAIVANAVEALGQDVVEEAADKRVDGQCHGLVTIRPLDAIILPFECDASFIHFDQATIGDGDAMGVACEISQHSLRPAERLLGVNHPFRFA